MRVRFFAFALLATGLAACGRSCDRGAGDAAVARPAPALPAQAVALVATDDPKRFLDGLRGQFRDRASAAPIPANASELVASSATLPAPVLRHIPDAAPLRAMYVTVGDSTRVVYAVRATIEASPEHPLGLETAVIAGGPEGSRWVGAAPTGSDVAIALFGNALVVGENRAALEAAGRYLAEVALAEPAGEGLTVHVYGSAFDGSLRAYVDQTLDEWSNGAIASARAERARHAEGAFFGEPERLVELVRDRCRRLSAYMPDVASLDLRIVAGANGVTIDGRAAVEPNSPLARTLASIEVGAPLGFASLPDSVALAIASRRATGESPIAESIATIAGSRLSADERASLTTGSERLATMRGGASLVALGAHTDGSFALFAAAPGAAALEPDAIDAVLRSGYARGLLGGVTGCEEAAAPSLASGRSRLCAPRGGPEPTLELVRGQASNVLMLTTRAAGSTAPHGAGGPIATANVEGSHRLFGDPDSERALAAIGDRTFLAVVLSARGMVPSLGLLGSARLRSLAASRALPASAAPIVVGLSREQDGAIGFDLVAPPRSIEESYALAMLFALLAGAGG